MSTPANLVQPAPQSLSEVASQDDRWQQPFWPVEQKYLALLLSSLLLTATLRSVRLMTLFPVLVDEAIYLRWAEIIQHRHTWFISLLDAKPPLTYWIYSAMRLVFTHEPLLGNRLVSVAAGTACVLVLYRIGFICSGAKAGAITASLYAILPFGVLYDRLAYVDSLVNLGGACLVYASLSAFARPALSWRRTGVAGMVVAVVICIKTTVLLFALVPLALGIYAHRCELRRLVPHFASAYGMACLCLLWLQLSVPNGPTFSVNNVIVHHTNFFTPLDILLRHPFWNLSVNCPLLTGYATAYISYPAILAMLAALIVLVILRHNIPLMIVLACLLPFGMAAASLEYFPSRYAFPLVWPLLLVMGCAFAAPGTVHLWRKISYASMAIVCGAMMVQCVRVLQSPEVALDQTDADEFLGPGPYSGGGVLPAVEMLRSEARGGPITILTDPWWGPPTDTVFAYLNDVDGNRVYEAWWLQLNGEYPLVPAGPMPMWRSQYDRVPDSQINFSTRARLYYITDTNYYNPAQVQAHCQSARLIGRFAKRDGENFIDVYRLN